MIVTENLSREYGHKIALFGLNLRVEPGESLGFLGPNGAGKSTTVKILTGMIRPTSGRASVAGFDVVEQPMEAKKRIGYVPETAALYDGLTAAEYLELIACLHHLDRDTARARSGELLDLFGLTADQYQRLSEFSKGMRQKVLIASALIHRPEVLPSAAAGGRAHRPGVAVFEADAEGAPADGALRPHVRDGLRRRVPAVFHGAAVRQRRGDGRGLCGGDAGGRRDRLAHAGSRRTADGVTRVCRIN